MPAPRWLRPDDPADAFPDPSLALREPNGLLAIGGDLSPRRLLAAYARGIFPWYEDGQPPLWWSPDPRAILRPASFHTSRSLKRSLGRAGFEVSVDQCFAGVVEACATRRGAAGTWLIPEMRAAYQRLHELGVAHSIEIWSGSALAGGLYGIALGRVFFGESMFSRVTDTSKLALVHLVNHLMTWGFRLIDCQVYSKHLISLGATEISRRVFLQHLNNWCEQGGRAGNWQTKPAAPVIPAFLATPNGKHLAADTP